MEPSGLVGLIGGITALITSVGTAVVLFLNAHHKNEMEKEVALSSEYRQIVDRQEKQIAKLNEQVQVLQSALGKSFQRLAECGRITEELWGQVIRFHDYSERLQVYLTELGHKLEPIPQLPEKPNLSGFGSVDFVKKESK